MAISDRSKVTIASLALIVGIVSAAGPSGPLQLTTLILCLVACLITAWRSRGN